jgi:hypothetical protein
MRTLLRFGLGFVIGCILFFWSLLLAGAGEGSITAIVSAAPELLWGLSVVEKWGLWGFWLVALPSVGLLWAIYFGFLPAIKSFVIRLLVVTAVALLHFGFGLWALSKDIGFYAEFQRYPVLTIGYFVFFWIVLLSLGALTWVGVKSRLSAARS